MKIPLLIKFVLEREEEKIGVNIDDDQIINDTKNYIGNDKSKNIALRDEDLIENKVKELEVELDKEDKKYEVYFKYNGKEYSYEINAISGKIIDKEIERD